MTAAQERFVTEAFPSAQQESAFGELVGISTTKRIMLIVSGRLFRNSIELVLRGAGGVMVSDCETLAEAGDILRARPDLEPDLFVVGMDMPDRAADDFMRIRALRIERPGARWIVLSNAGSEQFWWQAVESHVDGLLHQDSPGEVLQLLVRLILLGYSFLPSSVQMVSGQPMPAALAIPALPPATAERPLADVFMLPPAPAAPHSTSGGRMSAGLSERESDILRGLVAGQPNKTIARDLNISEATVKVHVKALLRKMQVTNRTQAAISALQTMNRPLVDTGAVPAQPRNDGDDQTSRR